MNADRPDVLFVDDESRILDGLRRQLRPHRENWAMRFAASGESALAMLAERPADILVSDMRMPGMTGGQLLQRVRELYPATTRIILSGQTDQADLLRELGCIHQYLQKPCDPPTLCDAIERTAAIAGRLRQPNLRLAASRIAALPPRPTSQRDLVDELGKPDACLLKVGQLIADDPALTAKLLQLVNSAFFGMPRKTRSPAEAAVLLGLKTLHAIVVAGRLFDFAGGPGPDPAAVDRLWDASLQIGSTAARLARDDGASATTQQAARLAGTLSLIGRAILMGADPREHARIVVEAASLGRTLDAAEASHYGAPQEDVSAYALGLWAFPEEIVEAVALQSRPPSMVGAGDVTRFVQVARACHAATEPAMTAKGVAA